MPLQRFNGFLNRMAGPQETYGGLLSPTDQREAANVYRATLASGLLSAAGPQTMPVSLGQALGGAIPPALLARDRRSQSGVQNEMIRRQIDHENKQDAARQKLGGFLRGIGGPDGELLGLLNDVSPELAFQGLTSMSAPPTDDPTAIAVMKAVGLPMNEQGLAKYYELQNSGDTKGLIESIGLQIQQLNLAEMQRKQKEEIEVARQERVAKEQDIVHGIEQTQTLTALTKKLEGTALANGLPASEWRRAGVGAITGLKGVLGFDTQEAQAQLAAFDEQKKGLSDQLNRLVASGQLNNLTDAKLRQYRDSLAGQDTQPAAIMEIQATIAQSYLDQADRIGFVVPEREAIETSIQEMRDYVPPGADTVIDVPAAAAATRDAAGKVVRRAAEIGRYSAEQIRSIDPSEIASWTEEQRKALEKRMDALGL